MKKFFLILITPLLFMACVDELIEATPVVEDTAVDSAEMDEFLASVPVSQISAIQSTNLANVQIIEGVGVGDIVTLGMTRDQIKRIATNGNCDTANECSFKLSNDTAAITVTFDSSNKVNTIEVNQIAVFPDKRWSTTRGAVDGMRPEQVAALYPGSTTTSQYPYTYVRAESFGYQYTYFQSCSNIGCGPRAVHLIFNSNDQPTVEEQRAFTGYVVVKNNSRKTVTANVDLKITAPDGSITTKSFVKTISKRGSITYNPGDFVSIDGPLGRYNYTVKLVNNRGKTVSQNSGNFSIILQ